MTDATDRTIRKTRRLPGHIGIVDVARLAGVSQATVSRALRGHASVIEATRIKVISAAKELGYVPSAAAAALASGSNRTIGVVAPWISRWFFSTVIEGVQEILTAADYAMLLYPIGADESTPSQRLDALGLRKRVDGVIGLALPYELRETVALRNLPIVTVGTSSPGIAGVQVDDNEVGYLATHHLMELGHQRIAFLGLDPDDVYGFRVADDRFAGYCRALREGTITPDPDLTVTTGFQVEAGEAAMAELLTRAEWQISQLPTAIVAVSDEVAIGVIHAARQWGLRVPTDLSVVGVDNHDMARLFDLTTVEQPVLDQGRLAASMLLEIIEEHRSPTIHQFSPGLIVRNSTAPPRLN